jgi:hypothetical protein
MTFPILGGNGAVASYSIDNSLRFNDDDSPRLTRTHSSEGNKKIWSYSTWFKRGNLKSSGTVNLISAGASSGTNGTGIQINNDSIRIIHDAGTPFFTFQSSRVLRDVSSYYHLLVVCDTTDATAGDRIKFYLNGNDITSDFSYTNGSAPSQNSDLFINDDVIHTIGARSFHNDLEFDGYMAETHLIDGTIKSPTDFGEFDSDSGIWKPKQFSGSYGTNGFYLDFENSGSLGADQSGNGNNFTPTNLASTDQTTDTPTNNWCTLNPLDTPSGSTFSEGNLKINTNTSQQGFTRSTFAVSQGKWYFETKITTSNVREAVGIVLSDATLTDNSKAVHYYSRFGHVLKGNTLISTQATFGNNDKIGVAFNLDDNTVSFYKNGTLQDTVTSIDSGTYSPIFRDGSDAYTCGGILNFGNNGSFAGTETAQGNADDNGFGDFYYAPPTGYLALCTQNLATELSPTIDDGSAYFHTQLYTGTGSTNAVTNDANAGDFQPDWLWIKNRSATSNHYIIDSNRGDFVLYSNLSNSEDSAGYFESFDSDGFTVSGNTANANASGNNFTAWQWKANGGTTSSNTDGSITATLQSNATSGFAIATWSGTGTAGTIGHNLGVAPKLVIVKRRNSPANSWAVQHSDLASNFVTFLNRGDTGGETDSSVFNGTYPTSSVFSVGTHAGTNQSGGTYVGYIFAPITGYSAMGTYTGNGSTDGTFVYTGFRPAFVIYKNSSSATDWRMFDNKRNAFNVIDGRLFPNTSGAENTAQDTVDFLSNGFKLRATNSGDNGSGNTFIYMCFAENPFVSSSGVPVVAR